MNSPTEKTPLELYTGLSRHDLYDDGSANRRPCIWKIGDMVQTSPYSKSYDAGCYGKIVKIEKSTNDNRDSSNFGDTWWTCYYQVMGPESKSKQIGKIWGMRDYCYDPYQPEKKPVQESVNMVGNVKKSNVYQKNPLLVTEALNPHYNGVRTLSALLSAAALATGIPHALNNKDNYWQFVAGCIAECQNMGELEEMCEYYDIVDLLEDPRYYYRLKRLKFVDAREQVLEKLRARIKAIQTSRKVGIGLAGAGAIGAALTFPGEVKAWKWALKH